MAVINPGKIKIKEKSVITFLSDFGTRDGYAGSVKGIIKSLAPHCEIIDISHDIKAFDIPSAAWAVLNYYSSFPSGTVHLAVVDPEVGSRRLPIILQTKDYFFTGPDNGIFELAASREEHSCYKINPAAAASSTFQGRDIFAPAAAKLALGISPAELGQKIDYQLNETFSSFRIKENIIETRALAIDNFGNIVTGFHKHDLDSLEKNRIHSISIKNYQILGINNYYSERKPGELLALWNSMNFLEIALNSGSAAGKIAFNKDLDKIIIKIE